MSKSPSLRRIQADIRELALDPSDRYYAAPLEHDMFEWHFTIRGATGTDFEGGMYHGRILVRKTFLYIKFPFHKKDISFWFLWCCRVRVKRAVVFLANLFCATMFGVTLGL